VIKNIPNIKNRIKLPQLNEGHLLKKNTQGRWWIKDRQHFPASPKI
jgi:hypothetical protein